MCGFVGFYDSNKQYDIDLNVALKKIHHRGPDAQDIKVLPNNTVLGFARLAIIDLTDAGEQPMQNEDGTITIAFNGEIFNYKELRKELIEMGHTFHSQSDTEVLLHMYIEYGMGMLKYLEGMYAVVIADQKDDALYLIRDRIGIKPLYYNHCKGTVAFGSEIKALLDMPTISKELSFESIAEFLQYEYIHAPNTIFRDIKKLFPGHYLKIKAGKLEDIEYWDCRDIPSKEMSVEYAKKRTMEELRKSLELHLRSDVPIGLFLSGGIDSGLLTALASEVLPSVDTYTLKFENGDFDESHLAELVAKHYNTKHHCYFVSAQDMKSLLPEILWFCDEPLGDSGILPNYIINSLVAKDGIKVVLSGAGGDELFAGYQYYWGSKKESFVSEHPVLAKMISGIIKKIKPNVAHKIDIALLLKDHPEQHMIASEQVFDEELLKQLLSDKARRKGIKSGYYHQFCQKGLNGLLYTDLKTYLTDDLMLLADRTTMAHSVEGRLPFLYCPLVEFAMSIPEAVKTPGKQRKWLLRNIAEGYLPQELLNAPKMGFCSPIISWGSGKFGDFAYEVLNSQRSIGRTFWNKTEYQKFVSDRDNYMQNFEKIYLLLILELFLRVHVDNNFTSKQEINLEKIYE